MTIKNKVVYGVITILVFALLAVSVWKDSESLSEPPAELIGVLRPDFRSLSTFRLVDQGNTEFTGQRFKGKWSLVFFGYTSCPDICPMTLSVINSTRGLLEKNSSELADDLQVIFISVDPQRDSTEKLADYIKYFNSEFTGVTGEKQEIDNLARQFGAGYVMEQETAPGEYLVAHTSAIFLVDPQARLVASFSQPHSPQTIAALYTKIRTYLGSD